MANFSFRSVATAPKFKILSSSIKAGDVHGHDVPESGFECLSFSLGSTLGVYDASGTLDHEVPSLTALDFPHASGTSGFIVAKEPGKYICVCPTQGGKVVGRVVSVPAGGLVSLNQGEHLYIAEGGLGEWPEGSLIYKGSEGAVNFLTSEFSVLAIFEVQG